MLRIADDIIATSEGVASTHKQVDVDHFVSDDDWCRARSHVGQNVIGAGGGELDTVVVATQEDRGGVRSTVDVELAVGNVQNFSFKASSAGAEEDTDTLLLRILEGFSNNTLNAVDGQLSRKLSIDTNFRIFVLGVVVDGQVFDGDVQSIVVNSDGSTRSSRATSNTEALQNGISTIATCTSDQNAAAADDDSFLNLSDQADLNRPVAVNVGPFTCNEVGDHCTTSNNVARLENGVKGGWRRWSGGGSWRWGRWGRWWGRGRRGSGSRCGGDHTGTFVISTADQKDRHQNCNRHQSHGA